MSEARAQEHNKRLWKALAEARAGRGYLLTAAGRGAKVHAARVTTKGHGGFEHPRSLCQTATPLEYHVALSDQSGEVTCKRCLTSLAK
jgi:hypothetical protein